MIYIVDGYNYLHKIGLLPDSRLESGRAQLVQRLRPLARKASSVVIVWDAPRGGLAFSTEDHGVGVRSVFATGSDADSEILSRVRIAFHPGNLCVVTDDRELAGRARQLGAQSAAVGAIEERLRGRMEQTQAAEEVSEKPQPPGKAGVAFWLKYFGEDPGGA